MFENVDMDTPPGLGGSSHFSQYNPVDEVTVHHFTHGPMPMSSSASLSVGRRIAQAAVNPTGWRDVRFTTIEPSRVPHREYVYLLPPPEVSPRERLQAFDLKEWGAPPTEDEIFVTRGLDDFEVTDLTFLSSLVLVPKRPTNEQFDNSQSYAELYGTAPGSPLLLGSPDLLHQRDLDLSCLYNVIPEPHFLPPLPLDTSSVIQDRIAPFSKTKPAAIPPHTLESIRNKLETPYARGGWIIPVRGTPPWEGCTTANVIKSSTMATPPPFLSKFGSTNTTRSTDIIWMRTSVLAFWNFLLHLRQARKLGHISLSFQPAPADPHDPLSNTTSYPMALKENDLTAPYSSFMRSSLHCDERRSLRSVDHFKIYCDVEFAMYIRNALDAWFLDWDRTIWVDESKGKREGTKKRVRPLEGARMAFVDERSRGLFVS